MSSLEKWLRGQGYSFLREIPGMGWFGIMDMAFTWDLFCNMTKGGYYGRYAYKTQYDAVEALQQWDGNGLPPGDWISHHGGDGYYGNPYNPKFIIWLSEVKQEAGQELEIDWRTAWRYFEVGLTPLQYYFKVWMTKNLGAVLGAADQPVYSVLSTEPSIVEYVHSDSVVLWALIKFYFKECSKLTFKEVVLEIR